MEHKKQKKIPVINAIIPTGFVVSGSESCLVVDVKDRDVGRRGVVGVQKRSVVNGGLIGGATFETVAGKGIESAEDQFPRQHLLLGGDGARVSGVSVSIVDAVVEIDVQSVGIAFSGCDAGVAANQASSKVEVFNQGST